MTTSCWAGAPDAAVVPIRVANGVVLLRTRSFVKALAYATKIGCQVATMSMGGLPSKAWAEAVDRAYDAGLCLCAASGNHLGFSPPARLVYPARYDRVIAVCGVMANHEPYVGLSPKEIRGSFGPPSAMKFAIAAYTPNIPWAMRDCRELLKLDGEGTSAATPQVAAAAALWIEKYKDVLPNDWQRVEAVRHALFESAVVKTNRKFKKHFGNGVLQARRALAIKPRFPSAKARESKNSFAFLRLVTGIGVDQPTGREEMFNVELAQLWLQSLELDQIVPDPDVRTELSRRKLQKLMEWVIDSDRASVALREHFIARYPIVTGRSVSGLKLPERVAQAPVALEAPKPRPPAQRRLRVYATDPDLSNQLETADSNEVTLRVRWEKLDEGPIGEYLEVEDKGTYDYPGVHLDDPHLLAQDGWAPSEGNPQFHQQMVYAVAMKTIEHFEHALGRPVMWSPRPNPKNPYDDREFVRRLAVFPHALRQANAYYSPKRVALLFGYFAAPGDVTRQLPGGTVYTCLSHDIVAHETTHAILDGLYRRFREPSNPDVLAFHEAFADIVALLQHFTIPELLEREIAGTRGDLEADSLLGKLAVQFGRTRGRGALRSAIGELKEGVWTRFESNRAELAQRTIPHSRGSILVGAVFDALIAIYNRRVADLLRLATGGSGVLPGGAIHPDLVGRLASEARKSAGHLLTMCIRALDFLPPVDVTFFDFLRALITADFEMVSDDRRSYRVALVEAFSRRGIFPGEHDEGAGKISSLSVDTLRWPGFSLSGKGQSELQKHYADLIEGLRDYANTCLYLDDREELFHKTRGHRIELKKRLKKIFAKAPEFMRSLGMEPEKKSFEVHTLRRAMRLRVDGRALSQVFVSLTQTTELDDGQVFRGGSTVVLDLAQPGAPKYRITKAVTAVQRRQAAREFHRHLAADPLRRAYLSQESDEPFGALHELAEEAG